MIIIYCIQKSRYMGKKRKKGDIDELNEFVRMLMFGVYYKRSYVEDWNKIQDCFCCFSSFDKYGVYFNLNLELIQQVVKLVLVQGFWVGLFDNEIVCLRFKMVLYWV